MAKIKKYLPGAESLGTSFGDKAGAFMGNYGGAIGSAASSLMPLLMKKPDPNAKPYKKGSKLIKYQDGNENIQTSKLGQKAFEQINAEPKVTTVDPIEPKKSNITFAQNFSPNPIPQMVENTGDMSFEQTKNMLPQDLLSRKDRMISKLPKFIQSAVAGKAKGRIERFEKDYNTAKSQLKYGDDLSELNQNRIARKIVSNRKNEITSGEKEELSKRGEMPNEQYPDIFERSKGRFGSVQEKAEAKAIEESRKNLTFLETKKPSFGNIEYSKPKMVNVEKAGKIKYFNYNSKESKGGYKRALNSKITDKKNGWLLDPETGNVYKDLSKKITYKSTKPNTAAKAVAKTTIPASNTGSNKNAAKPVQKNTQKNTQTSAQNTKQTNTQNSNKNNKTTTNTDKTTTPTPSPQKNVVIKKTARHTTDDPGKKMVNKKETPFEKKQNTPKIERIVYPGESPLLKYKDKKIYDKPATTIPSKVVDYRAQQDFMGKRGELTKNMNAYGMTSPYNEGGGDNFNTRLFETIHNSRFGKKK